MTLSPGNQAFIRKIVEASQRHFNATLGRTNHMEELKPCPFCSCRNTEDGEVLMFTIRDGQKFIKCTNCGAKGRHAPLSPKGTPADVEFKEAADAWNAQACYVLAVEERALAMKAKELPLETVERVVFVCSSPRCDAVWGADPRGHCPACLKPNGVGWSTMPRTVRQLVRDACEVCGGLRGGVRGNENRIGDIVMCDYCHADHVLARTSLGTDGGELP